MILCMTRNVQELFHVTELENYANKSDDMWHVTMETYERKRMFFFNHVLTGYTLVFYGLRAKQIKHIEQYLKENLMKLLVFDGFTHVAAEAFIKNQGLLITGKTNNRSIISNTTQRKHATYSFLNFIDHEHTFQKIISHRVNQMLGIGYKSPRELLDEHIKKIVEVTSSFTGYNLDIKLILEDEHVLRRVVVPNYYTLDDLHIVIQKLFGWKNMHLHEFTNTRNKLSYAPSNQDIDGFESSLNSKTITLQDAFDTFDEWIYTYDFGDDWKHEIFCRMSIHQKDPIKTYCSYYEGKNVPEDVGGIPGYKHFTSVMKDKNHIEYQSYQDWLRAIEYEKFEYHSVNASLIQELPLGFQNSFLRLTSHKNDKNIY